MLKFTGAPLFTHLSAALLLVCLLACGVLPPAAFSPGIAGAAATPYSDPGKTDFDTFLRVLKDFGTWEKFDTGYVFKPARPQVPMTNGSWIYTDWGWYWKGNEPYSFITDHYGNWVRLPTGVWAWRPDGTWSPHKIEWRNTETHIAWRPVPLNGYGEFLESDARRYTRPEEWIFIPKEKLKHPIQASDVVTGDKAPELLDNTESLFHIYVSYREIERPGPDPAEFLPPVVDNRQRAELNTRRVTTRPKPSTKNGAPGAASTPGASPTAGAGSTATNRPAITPHIPGMARAPGLRPAIVPNLPNQPQQPAKAPQPAPPPTSAPADPNAPAPLLPESSAETPAVSDNPGGPAPILPLEESPAPSGTAPAPSPAPGASASAAPGKPAPAAHTGAPRSPGQTAGSAPAPSAGSRLSGSGASHPLLGGGLPSASSAASESEESRRDGARYAVWIVMSLPTITTPAPLTAKPLELYVYRPRIYQDTDGINRRVEISLSPARQQDNRKEIGQILGGSLDEVRPPDKFDKSKDKDKAKAGRSNKTSAASDFPAPAQPVPAATEIPDVPTAPASNPAPRKSISTQSTKR